MKRKKAVHHLKKYVFLAGAVMAVLLAYGILQNMGMRQPLQQSSGSVSSSANTQEVGDRPMDFKAQDAEVDPDMQDTPGDLDIQDMSRNSEAQNLSEGSDMQGVPEGSDMQEVPSVSKIQHMAAGTVVDVSNLSQEMLDSLFYSSEITEEVQQRIQGISYHENENISLIELRYLRVLHRGFDGQDHIGELIVNQAIAEDILEIMSELYHQSYPIEKMLLIDEYGADDEQSMEDNNTSAFNYREIAGSGRLSNHAEGLAIDINPLYNPYVKQTGDGGRTVSPSSGEAYADREGDFPYKIDGNDLCCQLFLEHGFAWGGNWNSVKDYQHFEYGAR